jgi:hypothetical protein
MTFDQPHGPDCPGCKPSLSYSIKFVEQQTILLPREPLPKARVVNLERRDVSEFLLRFTYAFFFVSGFSLGVSVTIVGLCLGWWGF